jgi:hypothetical protein
MTSAPEPQLSVLNYVSSSDIGALTDSLNSWAYTVLRLDGSSIHDRDSLLAQVVRDLPSFSECRPHNWSSFEDCLSHMVFQLERPKIALVWTSAQRMVQEGLADFVMTVDIMATTTRLVYDDILFVVFLVGDGANFPPWAHVPA